MSLQFDEVVKSKVKHPPMYKVIFKDDNITTAEFVTRMLMTVFGKDKVTAEKMTKQVDSEKSVIAGIYTKNIAETKKNEVLMHARAELFPFEVVTEPVEDEDEEY